MYLPLHNHDAVIAALLGAQPGAGRWVLCVADRSADRVPALIEACAAAGISVCGGIFPGLIHGRECHDEGLIAIPMPAGSQLAVASADAASGQWSCAYPALPEEAERSALILVDGLARTIGSLLEDIFDHYGNRIHFAGAGAGYRDLRKQASIFTDAGFLPNAGLLIVMPVHTSVKVRHGWKRVSGPFIATRTTGNVIQELNWEPAGQMYRQHVEAMAPELTGLPVFPGLGAHYPLGIGKEGGEDVMRDPIAINEHGELEVLSEVAENAVMYLTHGDETSLLDAAREAVDECEPQGETAYCFIADCYSRALKLGDHFPRELAVVNEALARKTTLPAEGVLAFGEIAANGMSSLEFFNKTFVVALARQCH